MFAAVLKTIKLLCEVNFFCAHVPGSMRRPDSHSICFLNAGKCTIR